VRGDALLDALLPRTGRSFRLGISGVPGVGKSTFIEALGLHLHRPWRTGWRCWRWTLLPA
jgi:putative protein kinase ArgK-like GTPase of G3E family